MFEPLVSIIIPVYNRENLISETINYALNQTYQNIEIIIVDNCSTDNTFEIIKSIQQKDNRIKLYKNEMNIGPVKNWKKCIEKSTGKYIKILWSDDKISTDFLEKTVNLLENDEEIGFVYTKTILFDDTKTKELFHLGPTGKYQTDLFVFMECFDKSRVPLSPGNALFRRIDVEKNIIIDLNNPKNLDFNKYGAGNDLLIFLLTCPNYKYFYYLDSVKSFYRVHEDSISVRIAQKLYEYYFFAIVYFLEKYQNLYSQTRNRFFTYLFTKKAYSYMVIDKKFHKDYFFIIKYFILTVFASRIKKTPNKEKYKPIHY